MVSCPAFIGLGWALSECAKRQKIAEESRLIQKSFQEKTGPLSQARKLGTFTNSSKIFTVPDPKAKRFG